MHEVGRVAYAVVHLFEPAGRWLFVKIVVLLFSVTALARLVPWKPRRSVSKKSRRALVGLWSAAAVVLVAALGAAAFVVTTAEGQYASAVGAPPGHVAARPTPSPSPSPQERSAGPSCCASKLKPDLSRYLGVFEPGTPDSYQAVAQFAAATHTRPAIDLYYSNWGTPFSASFASQAYSHDATALIQMEPKGPGVSLTSITDGDSDSYLDAFAKAVRAFAHPVIIGFGPEMNGNWYPWGYTRASPASFVAAWRHVVRLFRRQGAVNVTWLWTVNEVYTGSGPLSEYWPGRRYVTWAGIDAYFVPGATDFDTVIGPTLSEIRGLANVPVIISETGIAPEAGQLAILRQLFAGVRADDLLGFIYFDANQLQDADYRYQWRLEDSRAAVNEYRRLARRNAALPHPAVTGSSGVP